MNGQPLPEEHGAPVRLVVPTWYGIASVKWRAEIVALDEPFRGFYQAERYVVGDRPVRVIKPRAVIVAPLGTLEAGQPTVIRGYAWSGQGSIARVELSTGDGAAWREAALEAAVGPAAWREFRLAWTPRQGTFDLLARATDGSGETQGVSDVRNELGYANNAAQPVRVYAR